MTGITTTLAGSAHVSDCRFDDFSGTHFSLAAATKVFGNSGYPTAANATDNGNGTCGVTHNFESGTITVPVPNAGGVMAGAEYIVLVSNTLVNTSSRVTVSVSRGTDTQGRYLVREVQLFSGGFNVPIKNDSAGTQNGTWLLQYVVQK